MNIPIIFNHDLAGPPVGFVNGEGHIKLLKNSGVTVKQLVDADIGYVVTKEIDGVVIEAELLAISIKVSDES